MISILLKKKTTLTCGTKYLCDVKPFSSHDDLMQSDGGDQGCHLWRTWGKKKVEVVVKLSPLSGGKIKIEAYWRSKMSKARAHKFGFNCVWTCSGKLTSKWMLDWTSCLVQQKCWTLDWTFSLVLKSPVQTSVLDWTLASLELTDMCWSSAPGIFQQKQTLLPLIKVYNVDGTPNKQGTINYYVDLNIEVHGCSVLRSSLVRFFSFLGCNCNCNRSEPVWTGISLIWLKMVENSIFMTFGGKSLVWYYVMQMCTLQNMIK